MGSWALTSFSEVLYHRFLRDAESSVRCDDGMICDITQCPSREVGRESCIAKIGPKTPAKTLAKTLAKTTRGNARGNACENHPRIPLHNGEIGPKKTPTKTSAKAVRTPHRHDHFRDRFRPTADPTSNPVADPTGNPRANPTANRSRPLIEPRWDI